MTAVATSLVFDSLAAGQGNTCGLTAERELYCWGRNHLGQIGDGTREQRLTPTHVPTP